MSKYLTPKEIKAFYKSKGWHIDPSSEVDVELAKSAVDHYIQYIASQMGPSPCEKCRTYDPQVCDRPLPDLANVCPTAARAYGYALGLQERDKLAWEIVEWLGTEQYEAQEYHKIARAEALCVNNRPDYWLGVKAALRTLEDWLASRGIRRTE